MNDTARAAADDIVSALERMIAAGIRPQVVVGIDRDGQVQARPLSRNVSRDRMATLIARALVGDIDPTLLEGKLP